MKKYDEIRSLKLFNKYCNNDFVCIISEWGNKVHQELGIKYNKGKCLEDIYAIDGRHCHSMSLQFEDEDGKVMIARKEASLVLSRTEMFEDILRYIEKHYGISIDDKSYLHLLKLIKENWYCIITNDEYCIEIFETRDVNGLSHSCTNELDEEIFNDKPKKILGVMDNISGHCFTVCSMCMSRYLDMSDKELKRFGV